MAGDGAWAERRAAADDGCGGGCSGAAAGAAGCDGESEPRAPHRRQLPEPEIHPGSNGPLLPILHPDLVGGGGFDGNRSRQSRRRIRWRAEGRGISSGGAQHLIGGGCALLCLRTLSSLSSRYCLLAAFYLGVAS
uniref:Uncharacterized protein n=1 Tax=Arundo donax TaxID=35708 RepID=A0A0A9DTT3_ARUDO